MGSPGRVRAAERELAAESDAAIIHEAACKGLNGEGGDQYALCISAFPYSFVRFMRMSIKKTPFRQHTVNEPPPHQYSLGLSPPTPFSGSREKQTRFFVIATHSNTLFPRRGQHNVLHVMHQDAHSPAQKLIVRGPPSTFGQAVQENNISRKTSHHVCEYLK